MLAKLALVGGVVAAVSSVLFPGPWRKVYQTSFEPPHEVQPGPGTLQHWGMFEEIVDPLYYATGLGAVERSDEHRSHGRRSLRVWPNAAQALVGGQGKSNHVIAQRRILEEGVTGRWLYEFDFLVPASTDPTQVGQTGPEWSVQSTREVAPGVWRTHIVGLQYIANPDAGFYSNKWQIWTESAPAASTAAWRVDLLPELNDALHAVVPGQWYSVAMEVDFTTNRYVGVRITGPNFDEDIDLSDIVIVPEVKFAEGALWISCEAENQFVGNQPVVRHHPVHYDRVTLSRARD